MPKETESETPIPDIITDLHGKTTYKKGRFFGKVTIKTSSHTRGTERSLFRVSIHVLNDFRQLFLLEVVTLCNNLARNRLVFPTRI